MTLPADTPKLPKWPFLIGDAALLGLAWLIADQSRTPFAGTPLIAIVTCVALGALSAAIPFLADYARRQDEALDERQRGLDSLARIVAASAEQISIAAKGLHEITELAHRNVKAAEQLPHKLQEKIATFKAELDNVNADEREELEKEITTLRAAESERLDDAADKIAKSIAELTRLEITVQKHVATSSDALTKATATLATIEARITATTERALKAAATTSNESSPEISADALPKVKPTLARAPRKARPEETSPSIGSPVAPAAPSEPKPPSEIRNSPSSAEPAPIPTAAVPEVASSDSAQPIPGAAAPPEEAKPARKRAPKKPKPEGSEDSALAPKAEEPASPNLPSTEAIPPSSDGATRLNVTAYIGIGNRLFIRGDGAGLSWDKGVPLQFVSIGKWRWEASDATAPVRFKLYKNDDTECAALGLMTLPAGRQEEVTATF